MQNVKQQITHHSESGHDVDVNWLQRFEVLIEELSKFRVLGMSRTTWPRRWRYQSLSKILRIITQF